MARMKATIPENASPDTVFAAIASNVDGKTHCPDGSLMSEGKAATYVQSSLAFLGHAKTPEILNAHVDGKTCRVYIFRGTPVGDVVLIAGPAFVPRFVHLEQLNRKVPQGAIFTLLDTDTSSQARHVQQVSERLAGAATHQRQVAQAAPPPPPPPAARARREAPAPAAPRARRAAPPPASPAPGDGGGGGGPQGAELAALQAGMADLAKIFA